MIVTEQATAPDGRFIVSVMEPEKYFYVGSVIKCLHIENTRGQVLFVHINHHGNERTAHGFGGQMIWIHKAILQEMGIQLDKLQKAG